MQATINFRIDGDLKTRLESQANAMKIKPSELARRLLTIAIQQHEYATTDPNITGPGVIHFDKPPTITVSQDAQHAPMLAPPPTVLRKRHLPAEQPVEPTGTSSLEKLFQPRMPGIDRPATPKPPSVQFTPNSQKPDDNE